MSIVSHVTDNKRVTFVCRNIVQGPMKCLKLVPNKTDTALEFLSNSLSQNITIKTAKSKTRQLFDMAQGHNENEMLQVNELYTKALPSEGSFKFIVSIEFIDNWKTRVCEFSKVTNIK